jgi:hypothetical protein
MRYLGGILTDLLLVMNTGYWLGSWTHVSPILLAALLLCLHPGSPPGSPQRDGDRTPEREHAQVTVAQKMRSHPPLYREDSCLRGTPYRRRSRKELSTEILVY